ncbi:putative ABC transport system permease protein [Mobilisporobacter senegalensis]|uniref:Putative ABC transport system permease protein n=1 Tax=Mobilisporobacter senegalensis TaxID=1329262 RepID=A0A3N1XRJ8_9FIRM|nr:ABC transporter permease [Mobilisporobacter senegalensis]ROR29300.1 putative ABC transport system permease protein [Mobilisporobacter senegalensis]
METILSLLKTILEQGFIYGILALGIYITYEILDYPDLSVDGTFPLGAAITVAFILNGVDPWIAIIISFLGGALAGLATGIFHVVFGIKDLLSGILTMTALYSINLKIAGRANVPITNETRIFNSGITEYIPESLANYKTLIIIFICVIIIKKLLDLYLKTKSGLLLRATGDNPGMVTLLAKNHGYMKIIGLMICNGLAAVGGSILAQQQRYFDSTMGTGMLVMGLASVIIGRSIFKKSKFMKATTMVLIGSVIYKTCLAVAIYYGVNPNDLKLLMTILFLIVLISNDAIGKGGFKKYVRASKN